MDKHKKLKDISINSKLKGPDGETTVTHDYEEHIPKHMFLLEMEDGELFEVSGNHRWYCETAEDRKNQKRYMKLAKKYFKTESIPQKLQKDELIQYDEALILFAGIKKNREFIGLICDSMGHSAETPLFLLEEKLNEKEMIPVWSYNDLVNYLQKFKKELVDNNYGYFYFGKTRTMLDIFRLDEDNINIPTLNEVKNESF